MEEKYLKDFVIALVVILLIAFGVKDYYQKQKADAIPEQSKNAKLALSEELLSQIQSIEESIQDRKGFVFTVTKDPLEQNLIVKTRQDLEQQWREKIQAMVRLESTIITEHGKKIATIAHEGKTRIYSIGDSFKFGTITDIRNGEITFASNGRTGTLETKKLPAKPVEIQTKAGKSLREYNW